MIKIEYTEVCGLDHALRGARNPMNSWDKADSHYDLDEYVIGENDHKLATHLAEAGPDHGKFLRMIQVYCDITAPFYLYKELDTYRMGVEKNSCSTMHKIHSKEFTLDDFSHDQMSCDAVDTLNTTIDMLNTRRMDYLMTKRKIFWWDMIQLLPSSYNQRRTYMFSYAALRNIYHARKNHKLAEWHEFCRWIESLPYSEFITGQEVPVHEQ